MATVSQKSTGTQRNYHSFEKTSRKARVGGCFSRAFVAELPGTGRGIRYFCRISPSGGRQKYPFSGKELGNIAFSPDETGHTISGESQPRRAVRRRREAGNQKKGPRRGRGDERRGGEITPGQRRAFRRVAGDPGPIAAMPCFQPQTESGRKDSNHRLPGPKPGALTRLSYAPSHGLCGRRRKSTRNRPKTSLGPVFWLFPPRHPAFRTASGSWASTPWRWRRRASR